MICCSYLICTGTASPASWQGIILKSQKNNLPQLYFNIIIVEIYYIFCYQILLLITLYFYLSSALKYYLINVINISISRKFSYSSWCDCCCTRSPHLRLLQPIIRNSERKRRLGVNLAPIKFHIFYQVRFWYPLETNV